MAITCSLVSVLDVMQSISQTKSNCFATFLSVVQCNTRYAIHFEQICLFQDRGEDDKKHKKNCTTDENVAKQSDFVWEIDLHNFQQRDQRARNCHRSLIFRHNRPAARQYFSILEECSKLVTTHVSNGGMLFEKRCS